GHRGHDGDADLGRAGVSVHPRVPRRSAVPVPHPRPRQRHGAVHGTDDVAEVNDIGMSQAPGRVFTPRGFSFPGCYNPHMNTHIVSDLAWERMVTAVEKVRERLRRAAQALEAAGIPYAVASGNAVASWVSEVDEAAVRNTQDVDIIIRRCDLENAK